MLRRQLPRILRTPTGRVSAAAALVAVALVAAAIGSREDPSATSASYAEAVRGGAPAAYWRFETRGGDVVRDDSGRGNAARYLRGADGGYDGAVGASKAAYFDGVDDRILFPPLGIRGAFTLELWVHPRSATAHGGTYYAALLASTDSRSRLLWNAGHGRLLAQFGSDFSSERAVYAGMWHHIVYVFDGRRERFYIDGLLSGSRPTTKPRWGGAAYAAGTTGKVLMLRGELDEVAVYPRSLSEREIAAHTAFGAPRAT